jgi:DNA end-binding protein Ku
MARPTWRGSISFGLVSVPVQLFTAVRSHDIRFRQLHAKTNARVRQQRVDVDTGEEVDYDDLVKGYETEDGRYVIVDPDELRQLAPEKSELIDIRDFVDLEEIDPVYYDRPYYLAPDGRAAAKPYRLLTDAMTQEGKVAIAKFVMRNKEYLAAIRARDGLLVLSTMHHADEVVDPAELDVGALQEEVDLRDREVEMARSLINSLVTDFEPEAYEDEYRQRLLDFLAAKAEGQDVELPRAEPDRGGIIDLTAALEQSLERARGDGEEDGQQARGAASGKGRGGASSGRTRGGASNGKARKGGAGRRADATPSGADYESMTRGELYELAQERDLPGRSSMSKQQLVAALHETDAEAGAA